MNARWVPLLCVIATACHESTTVPASGRQLIAGTWGGVNAGVIVDDSLAHVHIGCTFGNFKVPLETAPDGRFAVDGEYLLRAYPVQMGPTLPARFSGTLRGGTLTITVVVTDTVNSRVETLGPVSVRFGREPQLGACPICRSVRERMTAMGQGIMKAAARWNIRSATAYRTETTT